MNEPTRPHEKGEVNPPESLKEGRLQFPLQVIRTPYYSKTGEPKAFYVSANNYNYENERAKFVLLYLTE